MSSFVLRLISVAALACVACARKPEPSSNPTLKSSDKPKAAAVQPAHKPTITPAEALAKLGPINPEQEPQGQTS